MQTRTIEWRGLGELRADLCAYLERRCRDEFEVDEVAQEALLRAARYRKALTRPESLAAWLKRIANNVLVDLRRREVRRGETESEVDTMEEVVGREEDPGAVDEEVLMEVDDREVAQSVVLRHLSASLAELRQDDRTVLRTYYELQRGCRATGEECGLPPRLVKIRLFRARQRLARALRKRVLLDEEGERGRRA